MILFIIAGPGTASQTFKDRLLKTGIFLNKNYQFDLKDGKGVGHFKVKFSKKKFLFLKICHLLNFNLLFYQHLMPTKKNLKKLTDIFSDKKIKFIFVVRNIYDTAKHLKKLYFLKKKLPLDDVNKSHYIKQTKLILIFYDKWQRYFQQNPEKLNLITYNDIVNNKKKITKLINKLLGKKIVLNKKIIKNKYKKMNISLNLDEIQKIDHEILKYNKKNLIKIKVL